MAQVRAGASWYSAPREMSDFEARLQERFGLPSFHPWQREAIEELLGGCRRALVVAPTGGGKSLCYQFPATELDGTSLVVSPLISLMEDQVRALSERGIPATWLASTVDGPERRRREEGLREGRYRLVYVAPERLARPGVLEGLARLEPPLVAIDEAHCISQWGHDFRPDYLRLRAALEALEPAHVLACTATATPRVREEIVEQLGLPPDETAVVLRGFARPNLHLAVQELDGPSRRLRAAVAAVLEALGSTSSPSGGAIVYAATRKGAEQAAAELGRAGFRAAPYHAGLDGPVRADVNARFAAGSLDVVAATNAFGMGIDRPDIRAVVHVQAPGSIEAYYQEVGRAGRDGQPAHGLLIAGSADYGLRRLLVEGRGSSDEPRDAERIEHHWSLFLDLMRYVEAGSCRHDFILSYFGDEQETLGGCGHCDVCERLDRGGVAGDRGLTEEAEVIVKKALAGVARVKGRVGLVGVAEMLAGADTDKLRRQGLTRLSTYGVLSEEPRPWITALLRRLITARLVAVTPDEYPVPMLTKRGWDAMTGGEPLRVLLPPEGAGELRKRRAKKPRPAAAAEALDEEQTLLFERLRAVRRQLAATAGVPAYVVCHDRTLAEMALRRPSTLVAMSAVHGMGPARLDAYGEVFLEALHEGP